MEGRRAKRTYLNAAYIHEENGGLGLNHQLETVRNGSAEGAAAPSRYTVISLDDEKITEKDEKEEEEEEEDPWALPELKNTDTPWKELSETGKVKRVLTYIGRFVSLAGLLYMFICSLDVLSSAFRLLGGKQAGEALSNTVLFSNPIAGVMLGVLATLLVQSSSTSTSIVVSMVSAGLIPVYMAIPMTMGANIGTTVTNTIVAMGQSGQRGDFRRAFAAATVHDMFNWLSVLVFLPLEWASRYLYHLTNFLTRDITYDPQSTSNPEFLKAVTKPFTDKIVQLSTSKIRDIAQGKEVNGSLITEGDHLFNSWTGGDAGAGGILLAVSLVSLCVCLVLIVKLLTSLLKGTIATLLQRFINSDLPGPFKHLTGYLAILVGAGMTILVQSSSIFTSAITPLVGIGAIHIDRMYPLTLGSNIGTTITGILAALASDPSGFKESLQVALCHLFFNISGILLWFPVPFLRRIPISLAKSMGDTVATYRWFALVYLLLVYFLFPVSIFGLSLAGWEVLLGLGGPLFVLLVIIVIINILQNKKPHLLPAMLRTWEEFGVPEALRSLQPYDRIVSRIQAACTCCTKCKRDPEGEGSQVGAEAAGHQRESGSGAEGTGQQRVREESVGHRRARDCRAENVGHRRDGESEVEDADQRRASESSVDSVAQRRARVSIAEDRGQRRARVSSAKDRGQRRARVSSAEDRDQRRARVSSAEDRGQKRARVSSTEDNAQRRARGSSTEDRGQRRARSSSTEERGQRRRTRASSAEDRGQRRARGSRREHVDQHRATDSSRTEDVGQRRARAIRRRQHAASHTGVAKEAAKDDQGRSQINGVAKTFLLRPNEQSVSTEV